MKIVDRLRASGDHEAADIIERLREEVKSLLDIPSPPLDPYCGWKCKVCDCGARSWINKSEYAAKVARTLLKEIDNEA